MVPGYVPLPAQRGRRSRNGPANLTTLGGRPGRHMAGSGKVGIVLAFVPLLVVAAAVLVLVVAFGVASGDRIGGP